MKTITLDTINPSIENIIEFSKQEQVGIEVYTFATLNQNKISFHTDECMFVDFSEIKSNINILRVEYMTAEEQNCTIYANTSDLADIPIIAVFIDRF